MYKDQILGADLSLCLLRADPSVIKERFLQRGWKSHMVDEAVGEAAELEHSKFAELRVDTDGHSVQEVAGMVRNQAGNWPGLT